MLKKISLRVRLTVLSIILLTLCCIGLTAVLNLSANRMANMIEATPITPSFEIGSDKALITAKSFAIGMSPVHLSDTSKSARQLFLYQSIASVIIIAVAGGGLTYIITGKALQPLQELSSQMKNRTVHNLSEKLPLPESHDEIADLTIAFNDMSGKLDEAFITQKRFSQSAAHELRTPLTVLKTKVDVFKKKSSHTAEEYDKLLYVITRQTNRLSDLVKDLLDLTNMDALDCEENIEIKSMLIDVSEELSCLAKDKNISVAVIGSSQTILGNQNLLRRAFYNLVENAIKYNVDNGKIEIAICPSIENVSVTVSDTGIGIPPELEKHIFEPFFRVDSSRSRQIGGAGLGLTTVKTIIDKHKGKIDVLKNSEGGTAFTITL